MHIMFIPSWYSNKRNPVHGSFFKEQAEAIQESGIKVTVAYNEIWPLTQLFKINEKIGISYGIEGKLKTYRYKIELKYEQATTIHKKYIYNSIYIKFSKIKLYYFKMDN